MRKRLIHGLIYLALAALAAGGIAYALSTNPSAVRGLVRQQLADRFRHVSVNVDRARLRLLGGILVRELRLSRNDGLDRRDFLYVPTAVIFHDKEHLFEGNLSVHKVELTKPQIRIVRERDGRLNVAGILGPTDLSRPLPSVVIRQGTIVFEDRGASASPLFEIRDVQLSLVNDPLPMLQIEGSGQIDVLGPVRFHGSITRANLAADLKVELPAVPVDHALVGRLAGLCPDAAHHAAELTGRAELTAHLRIDPDSPKPFRYDVTARFHDGRLVHRRLPAPWEKIEFSARCVDGCVPLATLKAHSGAARLDVRVTDLDIPKQPSDVPDLDELGRAMDVTITDLDVTPAILAKLPDNIRFVEKEFSPAGPVGMRYRYRKATPDQPLVREWLLEPKGMTGSYIDFRYPVHDIRGSIRIDTSAAPLRNISLDLTGKGDRSPVALRGTIKGHRHTGEVAIDIAGKDVLLDHRIQEALPPGAQKVAGWFLPEDSRKLGLAARPMGKGDFIAVIRRKSGGGVMDKRYVITFKNCRACYDQFPYPLENVSGVLDLMSDHWECRNFHGTHKGGEFFVEGRSYRLDQPIGPGESERVRVRIRGKDILLDDEFEQALVPTGGDDRKGLQKAWRTLKLAGRLSFTSEVIDHPGQPQDIDVTVGIDGCTLKPDFFPYAMHDVSGSVRYARNRVHLKGLKARHGKATLGLESGLIQLGSDGGYTAWLEGISGKGVPPDRDLLAALPESMRKGIETLALRGPADMALKLTVAAPPGGFGPVKVWWECGVGVQNAAFRAGVEITETDGGFFCRGHHDGRQLRGLWGDVMLERAVIFGQPIGKIHGRVEVRPDSPEVFRFRDLKADLFGGQVGGEARVEIAPVLRYDVYVEAFNVQLDQFGKHNLGAAAQTAQLSGPARAAVHLSGEGNDLLGLKGNGRVDVQQGKMGQLPVLLDLVKAFGLRLPDRTAFEQAQLLFALEGPRVTVQQLDLFGNAISLRGQGSCDLDGNNLELDFTASPGRLSQMLPPGLDVIPEAISQQLYKIKMRGKLGKAGELKFDQVPLPAVTEPLRRLTR